MALDPKGSAKTLVVVGPDGTFYAIPVEDLERYAQDLNATKQNDLDRLVSEAIRNGRLAVGFYFDKEVARDSAAFRP